MTTLETPTQRLCLACDEPVPPTRRAYCSERCAKRLEKRRERARKRNKLASVEDAALAIIPSEQLARVGQSAQQLEATWSAHSVTDNAAATLAEDFRVQLEELHQQILTLSSGERLLRQNLTTLAQLSYKLATSRGQYQPSALETAMVERYANIPSSTVSSARSTQQGDR